MPKTASSNPNQGSAFPAPRHRPNWIAASICFLLFLLLTVAFLDYSPAQSRWVTTNPTERNLVGYFGAESSYWALHWIGVSTWLIPLFLGWLCIVALRNARRLAVTRGVAMVICICAFSGAWAMWESFGATQYFSQGTGGLLGRLVYNDIFKDTLGVFGSALLLVACYLLSLLFIFSKDISADLERGIASLQAWWDERRERRAELAALRREFKEAEAKKRAEAKATKGGASSQTPAPTFKKLSLPKSDDPAVRPLTGIGAASPKEGSEGDEAPADGAPESAASAKTERKRSRTPVEPEVTVARELEGANKVAAPATSTKDLAVNAAGKIELTIVKPEEPKKARTALPTPSDASYQFPPLTLLREQSPIAPENSEEEHRRNAENLLRILGEFGVQVTLGEIHVGPVITRYEVIPAAGVRVEKIAGLDKNIALGMRAQSVRILAPIPGKAAVGVEVPNQHPTPVGMREILESEDWSTALSKGELPVALGKDVSGKPIVSDLTKMPHLLIAGATGSGKSVCINSIVASILYSKSPKDLRLIMVDPKIVELKIFNPLPHMLIPVVTEPKKVPAALKWLLGEMEQRYQMFAKVGVRNIVGFNNRKKTPPAPEMATQPGLDGLDSAGDEMEIPERLPYIVAIVDELADLMMVAPAEIETSIARLAQLARAAGIHLIIATQRPSVNVITGVIKANLPSRIAFQVASQVDSRTILDTKGADTLIGRGDMLFSPPGSSRLVRAQGAFVSDDEVHEVVEFLKKNGPPIYANDVQAQIDRAASDDEGDDGDGGDDEDLGDDEELYQQAMDVLRSTRRASTSMIQRRLRIGYNRAARIMDLMEQKGIVGPENGSSPRDILVDLDKL